MEEARWLEVVRRIARELPQDARVVVLHRAGAPSDTERRVVTELAATLARHRARVLLIDLGPPGSGLYGSLAVADAPGLRDVLGGHVRPIDVAVHIEERDFIYLPPGRSANSGEADDPATHPDFRRLLARARRGGATTLLYGVARPGELGEAIDGIIRLEEAPGRAPERRSSPTSMADRATDAAGTQATDAAGARETVAGLPLLARLPVPSPERRLLAAGRWPGEREPVTASGGPRRGRVSPTRPRRRPHVRHRRPRRRPKRGVASDGPRSPAAVLVPLALAAYVTVLAVTIALVFSPDADEDGGAGREVETPVGSSTLPSAAERLFSTDPATGRLDSIAVRLPPPLPFSTFSIGSALGVDPLPGPTRPDPLPGRTGAAPSAAPGESRPDSAGGPD